MNHSVFDAYFWIHAGFQNPEHIADQETTIVWVDPLKTMGRCLAYRLQSASRLKDLHQRKAVLLALKVYFVDQGTRETHSAIVVPAYY